ncbi:hypothetical protein G3N55_07555 [Dissulfurirhabdus thermomarina]|uniref:Uncharacterized protein n=1 Tax=Dissulfurirhabdus thermomarina TaxID=1765737 RepID=A0A6N9TSG7_DISTH|nr:hypothetical protein [Dissulfurirhabdus thermomarina]NDY42694.1 hypothetical protein [Dissulfurirhabdus thermomarina]NMX24299.1 hypothetical protein [Dissulfurirhabdus thermomarina]
MADLPLPLGRRAECPACGADLHCCRMCAARDPGAGRGCREPNAEAVRDPERANFCDWFRPGAAGEAGTDGAADAARAALEALFRKG